MNYKKIGKELLEIVYKLNEEKSHLKDNKTYFPRYELRLISKLLNLKSKKYPDYVNVRMNGGPDLLYKIIYHNKFGSNAKKYEKEHRNTYYLPTIGIINSHFNYIDGMLEETKKQLLEEKKTEKRMPKYSIETPISELTYSFLSNIEIGNMDFARELGELVDNYWTGEMYKGRFGKIYEINTNSKASRMLNKLGKKPRINPEEIIKNYLNCCQEKSGTDFKKKRLIYQGAELVFYLDEIGQQSDIVKKKILKYSEYFPKENLKNEDILIYAGLALYGIKGTIMENYTTK